MTPSRSQSTEATPTTLVLLLERMQDAAVLPSPSLRSEAVDLRNQGGIEKVIVTTENGDNTKRFVYINFNYT